MESRVIQENAAGYAGTVTRGKKALDVIALHGVGPRRVKLYETATGKSSPIRKYGRKEERRNRGRGKTALQNGMVFLPLKDWV